MSKMADFAAELEDLRSENAALHSRLQAAERVLNATNLIKPYMLTEPGTIEPIRIALKIIAEEREACHDAPTPEEHPILGAMRALTDGGLLVYRRPDGREGYHVVDLSAERLRAARDAAFPPERTPTEEPSHA